MEAAEGGHLAIEHRDAAADDAGVRLAVHLAVGDEAAGGLALVDLENLAALGVADDGLAGEGLKKAEHGLANLVDEFVNDGVKLDLDPGGLGRFHRLGLHLDVEAHDDRFRGVGVGDVGFGYRARRGGDELAIHLRGLDGEDRFLDRLDRTLHIALEDDLELVLAAAVVHHGEQVFHAVAVLRLKALEA